MPASTDTTISAAPRPTWQQLRANHILRNAGWMMASQIARVALQLVYLLVITRTLRSGGYGMFEAALALVFIVAPFSGWGASNLLVMHVARDRTTFAAQWGNVLVKTAVSAIILSIATVCVARVLMPGVPSGLVLTLSVAIFLAQRMSLAAAEAFQAVETMALAACLTALPYAGRLLALGLALRHAAPLTAVDWGIWYLASSVFTTAIAFMIVTWRLGAPAFDMGVVRGSIKEGAAFSMGIATDAIYSDVDKALMARLSTLEATGIYAAAYRAVDTAFVPIQAVMYATYPRFFVHGRTGIRNVLRFSSRVLPYTVGLGVAASACLWSFAFLMPRLLGPSYMATADAVRVLSPLPSIQALYYLAGDTLTGAGYQRLRSLLQGIAVFENVSLNLWLVPRFSWQGASWATIATEGSLAALMWIAVWRMTGRERLGEG